MSGNFGDNIENTNNSTSHNLYLIFEGVVLNRDMESELVVQRETWSDIVIDNKKEIKICFFWEYILVIFILNLYFLKWVP